MIFNKDKHTYTHKKEPYTPVSNWVKRYVKPFPAKIISKLVAKKQGVKQKYILGKWDLKADYSKYYGSGIHGALEYYNKYKEFPEHEHLKKVVEEYLKLNTYDKWFSEVIVYDEETKIAGTIDILVSLGNKEVIIRDVKTNGNLHKKGKGKLLPPYDSLEANNINKYRLQLSMYKKLAEARGLKVVGIEIWYWTGVEFEIINIKPIKL